MSSTSLKTPEKEIPIQEMMEKFLEHPHLLGHALGYRDLTEIHSEWIKYSWLSKDDTVLMAYRNSMKSTAVVVLGIVWWLLYNPNSTILIMRKSLDEAKALLGEIKQLYETDIMRYIYQQLGVEQIKSSTWRVDAINLATKQSITKEANIEVKGLTSSLTGGHWDYIVCDDICTAADRYSHKEREQTKAVVKELHNLVKVDGRLIFVGTPWHEQDVFSMLPPAKKYPVGSIKIRGHTRSWIARKKRSMSAAEFSCNYKLEHLTEDENHFAEVKFAEWPKQIDFQNADEDKEVIAFLDTSFSGIDFTALAVGCRLKDKFYIRVYSWSKSIIELYQTIIDICNKNEVMKLCVESNADQGMTGREFRKLGMHVNDIHESTNKFIKIMSFLKVNWHNVYLDPGILDKTLDRIRSWTPNSTRDDEVDAMSSLLRELDKQSNFYSLGDLYGFSDWN